MNREKISKLALDAGFIDPSHPFNPWSVSQKGLERFVRLVEAERKPLTDLQIDAVTVQQWGWDVDFAAHRAYARAIERAIVGAAPDTCPVCGEKTTLNHGYVCNIETNWRTCNECDWVGEPE